MLTEDEALLTYLIGNKVSFVFAVRRDRVLVKKVELDTEELEDAVTALRRSLAPEYIQSLADSITRFLFRLCFSASCSMFGHGCCIVYTLYWIK